jgi:hypothetical protein
LLDLLESVASTPVDPFGPLPERVETGP